MAREKPHQRRVFFVQAPVDVVGFVQNGAKNLAENLLLFVAKEQPQCVTVAASEGPVDRAEDLGQIGAAEERGKLFLRFFVRARLLRAQQAAREIVVAQMQDAPRHRRRLLRDLRDHARPTQLEARSAAREDPGLRLLHAETVDARHGIVVGEQGVHSEVGPDVLERDGRRTDRRFVDAAAVSRLGNVARRPGQGFEDERLEVLAESVSRKLQSAPGVSQDLPRLDAADVVEEPAAARVHQLGVPLELQELPGLDPLGLREFAPRVLAEEPSRVLRRAVENHSDVGVPGLPRVREERSGFLFPCGGQRIPQGVQPLPQGRAPGLIPAGMRSALAAAVRAPALDSVYAAPGRLLADPGLVRQAGTAPGTRRSW